MRLGALVVITLTGCTSGKADDSGPVGLDVSGLTCAGFSDSSGVHEVPTWSESGCDGGRFFGQLTCLDCSFADDNQLELGVGSAVCTTTHVELDGSFDFGVIAPWDRYGPEFEGKLADGDPGSAGNWTDGLPIVVCSDDVEGFAEVHHEDLNGP